MNKKIELIRRWLGTGSINIFGLPFSGKDTVGIQLAEDLNGKFLSSGLILRSAMNSDADLLHEMNSGMLASTDKFRGIVLPYFERNDLKNFPLILSSVGRWEGEEYEVIKTAENSQHEIKAVILLSISEAEMYRRWEATKQTNDRGEREDDRNTEILKQRLDEFAQKTMPVVQTYQKRDLLIPIMSNRSREEVYKATVDALYNFAVAHERQVKLD